MPTDRNPPPDGSDPLDELLTRAQWPEPTPLQMARLESAWDRARPAASPVMTWARFAAAAAVLLVSLITWKLLPTRPEPVINTPVAIDEGSRTTMPDDEQRPPVLDDDISRPPTPLELVLLQAAESTAKQNRRFRETDPLERAVARLMEDPQVEISELLSTFNNRETLSTRILAEMPSARGQRRVALARLLVGIEPADSLPVLLSLWSDPTTRGIVEPTVVRLADVPTLASLVQARQSFDDRVRLLTEIGYRPEIEAQSLLIEAAIDANTRPAALAAARRAVPPAELLFSALSHPQANIRIAAALLLGEHSDPQITAKLVALARESPNQSETWIALLQRNDAESRSILGEARQHPQIMASVNLAEATRQTVLHPVQVGGPL